MARKPVVYALLPVEVLPAHIGGMGQGLHLQRHVPLTLGDGDRPPQGLLSAFVISLSQPEEPSVAREEAPCLVGIGRDQGKSAGDQLTDPWDSTGRVPDLELRGSHRLGDISRLGVVLEGAAQGGEGFPNLIPNNGGGLGSR